MWQLALQLITALTKQQQHTRSTDLFRPAASPVYSPPDQELSGYLQKEQKLSLSQNKTTIHHTGNVSRLAVSKT